MRGRRALAVLLATLFAPALIGPAAASAQESGDETADEAALGFGSLSLTLVDHSIDVGPGGDIVLTYEIDGDLADAELLFIDQAPDPTTTTTSPTTTTVPVTTPSDTATTTVPVTTAIGAEPPADPAPATTPVAPPPTSTTTVPVPEPEPPVALSVDVFVDDRLDEVDDLIGRLGPGVLASAFAEPFDGVRIDDIRPDITITEDGSVTLRLVVPTDEAPSEADRLGLDDPGLYPLLVTLRADGEAVARHGTVVNRVDPVPVAATIDLAAIAAVAQPTTLVDDAELAALTDDAARITEFAEVVELPLLVSIPPRVVDALTVGTSAGAIVASSLRDDSLQSLPATPFDVSAAVAIERDDAFVRQLTIGEEQLQAAVPGTPVRRDVWLVDRPLSGDAAALLRTLGVRLLVMTPAVARDTLDGLPEGSDGSLDVDRSVDVALPDASTLPALLLDEDPVFTPRSTRAILERSTPIEWAIDHLARLRLELEEDADDGVDPLDPRGRLVASPDLGPLDERLLNELVRVDERTRIIDVVSATDLAGAVAVQPIEPNPTLPETAGPSLVERVATIEATALRLLDASSMLPPDDQRPARWTQLLDSLVSTAYSDDDVDAVVTAMLVEAEELTSSIVPPEPFSITLTSRRETIPIEITNTADEPLRVRVELTSQRLLFPDGDPEVELPANATTTVEVPVEARSNGTTSVEVRIVTPLGGELTEPVRISTRVQSLSGLAQLVTATLVLLLLTWWFNHWRQRRRSESGDAEVPPTDDADSSPTGDHDGVSDDVGGPDR